MSKAHLANMSLVTSVLDIKTAGYLHTNLWWFVRPFFFSLVLLQLGWDMGPTASALYIPSFFLLSFCNWDEIWVPQHQLVLSEGSGNMHLVLIGGNSSPIFWRSWLLVVNNGQRLGHSMNWLTSQRSGSAASPRLHPTGLKCYASSTKNQRFWQRLCEVVEGTMPSSFRLS